MLDRRLITVFGGAGFLGRHIVRRLARDGWIIRVASRDRERPQFLKIYGDPGQVVPILTDITRPESVISAVVDADAVINLVGILAPSGRNSFDAIHAQGAANVAAAARDAGAARLIQLSAIGADPNSPSLYARTKAAGEQAAKSAFPDVTILRPSVVFGPEDDFFNRFARLARMMPVLPTFETKVQPVYVGDVADAAIKVLDEPATKGKTYELGGPRVMTYREVMEIVLEETGRKRLLMPLPLSIAAIQGWFFEKLPKPMLTRDQVKLLGIDNVVSAKALGLKDLGIPATAVEAIVPSYLGSYMPPVKQSLRGL
ncbi:MAG: complex I NDUFA9 subunit family protein [Rhodospirillales bacterium]|nr:complex I NDUFA9 subunit family protein [Rhodospirillales bacterium]